MKGEVNTIRIYDLLSEYERYKLSKLTAIEIETSVNFIGRTISLSEFRFVKNGKRQKTWDYLLNVRPNTDQIAADFWQDFVLNYCMKMKC